MKVQGFSEIQGEFQFSQANTLNCLKNNFQSDLSEFYTAISWKELIKEFGIKENVIGRPFVFPAQERIALMFFKNYSGPSDRQSA